MRDRELFAVLFYSLFAGAILGFAFAQMGRVPALCAADDTDCIRDWVSATSGWAAVVAAALTVLVINKQIRASNRQHLEQMKFLASERLLLAEQLGRAASGALSTVTQIFHEYHDDAIAMSQEKLALYVDAAKYSLEHLQTSNFTEIRFRVSGTIPHKAARADVALAEFVKLTEPVLLLPEEDFEELIRKIRLTGLSSQLKMAYDDLRRVVADMNEFRRSWSHLSM